MAIQKKGPHKSVSKPRASWRELFQLRCGLINSELFDPLLDGIWLGRGPANRITKWQKGGNRQDFKFFRVIRHHNVSRRRARIHDPRAALFGVVR
jgi:hypothetical protein